MTLHIACLCVTENRLPIFGIALESFLKQRLPVGVHATLYVCADARSRYDCVIEGRETPPNLDVRVWERWYATAAGVPREYDAITDAVDAEILTVWDDDDFAPADRLAKTVIALEADALAGRAAVTSYAAGWFCNLRTLRAQYVDCRSWSYWGGCLAWTRGAAQRQSWRGLPCPGYDRWFVKKLGGDAFRPPLTEPLPVAFSHGKNLTTWLTTTGEQWDDDRLFDRIGDFAVCREVRRAQQFLIDRRVFPPQP